MSTTISPLTPSLVFERADELGATAHELVMFCQDEQTGLRAIIALHDTTLGPALGGTRFYPYASEAEALTDVLRLSQGMTYKAAAAGLALGGGKAVIIGDPDRVKSPDLLASYGRFVESLGGRYYTAADVGTTAEDLDTIAGSTSYVVGTTSALSGSGDSGLSTAFGVACAMQAAAEITFGPTGLQGRSVAIEGVGKVGSHLARLLLDAGADVLVSDVDRSAVERLLADVPALRDVDTAINSAVDVYAPCALGATLSTESVRRLRATLVCGAANNQLESSPVAEELSRRHITWVPDYIANAGGLIQVGGELSNDTPEDVRLKTAAIADTVRTIIGRARADGSTTAATAHELVLERLNRGRSTRTTRS